MRVYHDGTLQRQTDYTPGALYASSGSGNPVLQYLSTPAGRAVKNGTAWSYEYFLTDHLGSVRVVFGDGNADGTADVVQDNAYYPFGMTLDGLTGLAPGAVDNPFKYQGKEMQDEIFAFGGDTSKLIRLNLYDFHARQYDPVLGRWHVPDPVMQHASPYLAMGNNPMMFVDPFGLRTEDPPGGGRIGSILPPWCRPLCGPP